MAGQMLINTDQVGQIASNIESQNKKLSEVLEESRNLIKSLSGEWEGEAAQATISAVEEFAAKYFQNYYDVIDGYVKFLRTSVEQGYTETETANVNLADAFK